MKVVTCFLFLAFVAMSLGTAHQQPVVKSESCGFNLASAPAQATVTGPDDIVPLAYVVPQPDSPIEIVSLDLA